MDPSHEEEYVMEGRLIISMNIHKEICTLQLTGGVTLLQEQVLYIIYASILYMIYILGFEMCPNSISEDS